jgi:bifunctional non-homologous end joining protein LigD
MLRLQTRAGAVLNGSMTESTYDRKRSFSTTPEPPGEHAGDVDPLAAPVGPSFVIQQHHATALHHDVRLEMINGDVPVLVSWAVPKGLPRRRGDRHLAIRTEDHPMKYATFSGSIPEGEYGGGEVRIFDEGTYEMVGRTEDRLTFRLHGERLTGVWHLVHTGPMNGKDGWLALMSKDEREDPVPWPDPEPMLATPSDQRFDEDGWGFEPKWPGMRVMARCTDETHLFDPAGAEVTDTFPDLAKLHDRVVALDAMVDGVIVAFADGRPAPDRLDPNSATSTPIAYLLFDLLSLDGEDLTERPLRERRQLLEELIVPSDKVQISPLTEGNGEALLAAVADQGLDGVIAKRLDSRYQSGPAPDWRAIPVNE